MSQRTDAGLSVYANTLSWSPVPRGCTDLSRVCDLSVYAKVLDCLSVQACYKARDPTKMGAALIASATVPYPRVLGTSEGSPVIGGATAAGGFAGTTNLSFLLSSHARVRAQNL